MTNQVTLFLKVICLGLPFCAQLVVAQSGGTYQITQSVIANSGGTVSNGPYSVENTAGQPIAGGFSHSSPYSLYSGFWTPPDPAPTAATVSIGGRVTAANGQGIRNAIVTLIDSRGSVRTALTASLGYYRFDEVGVGETYVLSLTSKSFNFSDPTRLLNVTADLTDINFIAEN